MSSRDPITQQTLALAGVARFVLYAHDIAAHGKDKPERVDAALHAIFCTDPDDAADVVGNGEAIQDGVQFLCRQFGRGKPGGDDATIARYIGQVLRLSGRLLRKREAMTAIRGAIDRARLADPRQAPAILDQAYREHVSTLGGRIMVRGHPTYLDNAQLTEHIRTSLLAAVRCGVLWRQCGGRFWRLIVMRRRFNESLAHLVTQPANG